MIECGDRFGRRARRGGVGVDRFLPVAEAGEDVRRHVERVRRIGRDIRIRLGCVETMLGDRRRIVGVDEIVGDTGMTRLRGENLAQDRRRLQLVGEALVGRRGGDGERQGVVDLRFPIVGIASGQLLHRLQIGKDAAAMVELVVIAEEGAEGLEIVALALRLGAERQALLDRGEAVLQHRGGRRRVRIAEPGKRQAPMRHRAGGVELQRLVERVDCRAMPERVLIGHAKIEFGLGRRRARGRELDLAEDPAFARLLRRGGREANDGCRERGTNRSRSRHGHGRLRLYEWLIAIASQLYRRLRVGSMRATELQTPPAKGSGPFVQKSEGLAPLAYYGK